MAHCDRKEGNTTGPDLGRRRESLRLFNELLRLGDDPDLSIEETFNKIARLIPACWHDPEAICSRIIFQGAQYKSINFRETDKKLYSELMAEGRTVGSIEVCHTRPGPDCDEGAFIEEERELLESLAWKLGRIISGKEAATASKDSQKFYRMVQELSDVGTWVWDIVNNNIDWSDDVIRLWGYARDDFRGTIEEVARRVHPDDLEAWRENVRACIEDGKEHRLEMRIILPGGKVRWMDAYGNAERDDQGKAVRMMGIVMDITDRKLAEEDLRREKQRLNITGDMARVGGWEIDLGNNTVFWTRTTRDIHEVSEEYVPTLEEAMDFFPEAREVIEEAVRRAREENIPYDLEIPFLTAKGRKLWTRTIGKPEFEGGKCARLHGVFQDITEKREVEEALRQRERLLTWAIEQLPIPVIIADAPDVSISRYNKAAFDLLAIPTEHLEDIELGEHREFWPTFYPDGSPYDVLDLPLTRAIRKGEISKDLEIILRKTDGDHWISASAAPLRDENGNIMAGIVVFPEITDRKLAEHEITESRTFLDTIIDKSPFAMWISDPGGTVIRTNHALHEALNLTSDQIVGHYNVLKDKNLEMQGLLPRIKQVFEDFKPTRFIVSWEAEKAGDVDFDGGSDLHIDASMFPIVSAEGDLEHVVCQWVDISDLKRVENELRNITRNLDLLVKERTLDLEAANRELESFAFSVSHDLRAPLRSIKGFADIIAECYRDDLNEKGRHYFDNIAEASDHMSLLIEDLLKYARLGKGGVKLSPLSLEYPLETALKALAVQIEESGAIISLPDSLPSVIGMDRLLEQVFANLMGNALKYRHDNENPRISLSWEARGEKIVMSIKDNGIGIDRRYHKKIFDVFQRLHSDEVYPGTGIGLAIVDKAVALMGGRIWVESVKGEGSEFFVALKRGDA